MVRSIAGNAPPPVRAPCPFFPGARAARRYCSTSSSERAKLFGETTQKGHLGMGMEAFCTRWSVHVRCLPLRAPVGGTSVASGGAPGSMGVLASLSPTHRAILWWWNWFRLSYIIYIHMYIRHIYIYVY